MGFGVFEPIPDGMKTIISGEIFIATEVRQLFERTLKFADVSLNS
jgi:hypothetical protein